MPGRAPAYNWWDPTVPSDLAGRPGADNAFASSRTAGDPNATNGIPIVGDMTHALQDPMQQARIGLAQASGSGGAGQAFGLDNAQGFADAATNGIARADSMQNPYNRLAAGARQGQASALQQLMANTRGGPSIADAQQGIQQGQLMQQAAAAAGSRGGFLSGMGAAGGLAAQAGGNRLQESLSNMNAATTGANGLRAQDTQDFQNYLQNGYQARGIADQLRLGSAKLGEQTNAAVQSGALERYKLYQQLLAQHQAQQAAAVNSLAKTTASIVAAGVGA